MQNVLIWLAFEYLCTTELDFLVQRSDTHFSIPEGSKPSEAILGWLGVRLSWAHPLCEPYEGPQDK